MEGICNELLRDGLSADGLIELSNACRDRAKEGAPVLLWLALDAFFRRIGSSIYDRPVPTQQVEEISRKLQPLLETLSKPFDGPSVVERQVAALRNLL